ncbi:MAG: carbohydrate kinase [Acidobacteriota bacterium]|nr:carbohydrate kinase [Acidobacteriota bacterium]
MRSTPNASSASSTRREVPDPTLLLGVDLGSSGVKAVLLDPARGIIASSSREVSLYSDHAGWAEADPAQWWRALCELVPELLQRAAVSSRDVAAVAVAGMVPAVLVTDAAGEPLRRAILQNDARATSEIAELREALAGVDLLHLTGSVLSQQSVAPTLLWLARHEPEVWARTAVVQGSYDWLARALGAEVHVEENWALESGLFGLDHAPLSPVLGAISVEVPALPPVRAPGDVVGTLSERAARETGLAAGTTIVVGGADHVLSAFGAGLVEPGDCLVKLGGAGDILAVSEDVFVDERLYLDKHPQPGTWLPNGCMATSGSLLRWEQSLLGGVNLVELDAEADASEPGALLALPYFLGEKTPLHDPDLRGAILGLHLATTRGDVHRSFLEAIAYGFRRHVDVFADGGLSIGRTRVTNGGSRSRLWRQILADVLNRDLVSIIDHPGASFGAAVIAGVGCGLIADWSYVEGALAPDEVISPDASRAALYEERYHQFLDFTDVTTPLAHALARRHHD